LAKSRSTQQVTRVAELEETNALLRVELDAARSKLVEIEHQGRALTFENEGLKRDLGAACTAHDVAVKDKDLVQQAEQSKLQRFQDSIHKKLAELRRDTEASVSALGGRSAEFPTGASLSNFFKWFQTEIASMPTTFMECNKNITCYALINIFQMLATEGC
jgi:regulator of replication initiation timing